VKARDEEQERTVRNVTVIPMSSGEYVLQIQSEQLATDHRVDLPVRLLDELGLPKDRAGDVIATSVDWYEERDDEVPLRMNLGATWDEQPDFRQFLSSELMEESA
jgi:hypothetical protein